jgi:hypothetical protein
MQRADANDGLNQSRSKLGRIEIAAPTGTEVTVDGERVGTTPISDQISVEAGAHTVKFRSAEGATETDSVSVTSGEKVVARFSKANAAPPPAAPPPSAPQPSAEPAASPSPVSKNSNEAGSPEPAPKRESPPTKEHPGPGIWSAPKHAWPSIVLWSLAPLAFGGAAVSGIYFKGQAQDNANQTANSIEMAVPPGQTAQGICNHPPNSKFQQACTDFQNDNDDVNLDATVGNALIGVGAGFVVGGFLYWWFADKGDGSQQAGAPKPVVAPVVARGFGGLSVAGQF